MIITIDTERLIEALKIEGVDEYREAFISVGEFQKALKIAQVKESGDENSAADERSRVENNL